MDWADRMLPVSRPKHLRASQVAVVPSQHTRSGAMERAP